MGNILEIAQLSDGTSRSKLRGVGGKLPNIAGLYDTVGNVSEITHDLFRLIRPDGEHGARGGFVLRGGHVFTPVYLIGVPFRSEEPLFNARGETRPAFAGLRPVLVAPIFVGGWKADEPYRDDILNAEFDEALKAAHSELVSIGETPGAQFREEARTLIQDLKLAEGRSDVVDLERRLRRVENALEASEAAINEAARAELTATVRSAAIGIQNIRANGRLVYTILGRREEIMENIRQIPEGSEQRARLASRLEQLTQSARSNEAQITFQTRYVLSLLRRIAEQPAEDADPIVDSVQTEFAKEGLEIYQRVWPLFDAALEDLRRDPSRDRLEDYLPVFDDLRRRRQTRFSQ